MNNRASNKPPQEYFAGYESQSHSEKDEDTHIGRHSRQPSQAAMMLQDEKAELEADTNTSRPSGIFKFGCKLAATFNPSNWKIWQKEKPVEDDSIAERLKADAEFKRAYEEVKKRGYIQGNRPGAMASVERSQKQLSTQHHSDVAMEDASQANTESAHEDNDDTRTSGQSSPTRKPNVTIPSISQTVLENKYQRPFPRTPIKLPAVAPEDSVSNCSSSTSPRKGYSLLLQHAFNDDPTRPTLGRIEDPPPPDERRRQPLPKLEMEKQLNLVRKVSTLECKLRAAQEELALAMGAPPPPKKTRTGIDYEAIHAIQLQKQKEHGADYIATTAAAFIYPKRRSRHMDGATTGVGNTIASMDAGVSRTPLALVVNGETLPHSGAADTIPTIQNSGNNPQQRMEGHLQTKICVNADAKRHPSRDSYEESGEDLDSTTARAVSVKRVKNGPKKHNVEVVGLPDDVSNMRSVRGHVEGDERRGRPLGRSGEGREAGNPASAFAKNRASSEAASVKSTRSSRIPRPRSRLGTPVRETREMAPPVPALPSEKLALAGSIPKRSGSAKSLKATNKKFAVEIPAMKGTKVSAETAPVPKQGRRRSTSTTTVHGKTHASQAVNKSPFFENSRALTKSGSVKGGLHSREREMSPSKEGTFEWGPDVF